MVGVNGQTTASLAATAQAIPRPQLVRGLLDSGTDITGVSGSVLAALQLQSIRQQTTQSLAGTIPVHLYEVSLTIPHTSQGIPPLLVLDQLLVMGLPASLSGVDVLVGLDVLDQLLMIIDGPRATLTIAD
jgi:hypothetical protein